MAEQDVQIGAGTVQGIAGAITMTPVTGTALANGDANYSSIGQTTNFTLDELANSGGTYFESAIASKLFKDTRVDFIAKGTTRAAAETVFDNVDGWAALAAITIASATVSALNVAGNLISGVEKSLTREGRASISFTIRSYQKSDGTFGALAVVTG
jgi:hypothetical protein